MLLWDGKKAPSTPYSSGHLTFSEKDRKKQTKIPPHTTTLTPASFGCKRKSSFVNTNSFCHYSQGLSLSTIGSCTLLQFQTKLTPFLPTLGETVLCISLTLRSIFCSGPKLAFSTPALKTWQLRKTCNSLEVLSFKQTNLFFSPSQKKQMCFSNSVTQC